MTNDPSRFADRAGAPDWDAIARYLAGESPADEAARVGQWLEKHPADRALVAELRSTSAFEAAKDVDVEAALARVHQRMDASVPAAKPRLTLERPSAERRLRVFEIGFAVAAAGLIGFIALRRVPTTPTPTTTFAASQTYSTHVGQRDSVRLPDGTRVILGPESRLTVPGDFNNWAVARRTVQLDGNAYFDVQHNAQKPFAVHVANAVVEDIGTTFTIDSDGKDTTTVSVMSGIVRLRAIRSDASSGVVLQAGDRGSLTIDGQVRSFSRVVVPEDTAWTTGRLVFRDASLSHVAAELHRWYGITIQVADSVLWSRHVKTEIDNGQSVDDVLKVLAVTLGVRVERRGDTATFHPTRGSNTVK
jgi:transmembrane sensor